MKSRYEKCSKCGAPLTFKGIGEFECEYCGTSYFSGGVFAKNIYSLKKKISSLKSNNFSLAFISLVSILISYSFFRITSNNQNEVVGIKNTYESPIEKQNIKNIPIQVEKTETKIPPQILINKNLFEKSIKTKNKKSEISQKSNVKELIAFKRSQSNSFAMHFRLPINLSSRTRVKKVTYKSFRTSIKKAEPDDKFNFHFGRGYEKEKLGDFKEAISEYDKAAEINPNDADIFYFRGWLKGHPYVYDLKGSIADLEKFNQLEPNSAKNILDLAAMYARSNRTSEAYSLLERAIELEPDNGNLLWWKGMFQISNFQYVPGCKNARDGKYLGASDYDPTMREICY